MKDHWKCLFFKWLNVGFALLRGKFSGLFRKKKKNQSFISHKRQLWNGLYTDFIFFFSWILVYWEKRSSWEKRHWFLIWQLQQRNSLGSNTHIGLSPQIALEGRKTLEIFIEIAHTARFEVMAKQKWELLFSSWSNFIKCIFSMKME